MNLFRELVDSKTVRVLDVLLKKPNELFHIHKLSKEANVPPATTFRILPKLVKLGLVDTVHVGKIKLYQLGKGNASAALRRMNK
jgi:DNA-binding IclR family transcriptional regulator